jgi:hypothetical protein
MKALYYSFTGSYQLKINILRLMFSVYSLYILKYLLLKRTKECIKPNRIQLKNDAVFKT